MLYGAPRRVPPDLLRHVDLDDADTDGDGVLDGADDQDHDDVPNVMECSRVLAAAIDDNADGILDEDAASVTLPRAGVAGRPELPASGFVNVFNPCLPHYESRSCSVTTSTARRGRRSTRRATSTT